MKYKIIIAITIAIIIGLAANHYFGMDWGYCDNLCELRRLG